MGFAEIARYCKWQVGNSGKQCVDHQSLSTGAARKTGKSE